MSIHESAETEEQIPPRHRPTITVYGHGSTHRSREASTNCFIATIGWLPKCLIRRRYVLVGFCIIFLVSLLLFPLMGLSFFPRTDAGQFVISFKAPSGTKLEATEEEAAKLEGIVRAHRLETRYGHDSHEHRR